MKNNFIKRKMKIFIRLPTKVVFHVYFQGSQMYCTLKLYLDMQRLKDEMQTHLNDLFYFRDVDCACR